MNRLFRVLCFVLVAVPLFSQARVSQAQVSEAQVSEAQAPATNEKVPTIQGNAGPCALELTVLGTDRKAVYAASVKVHIKYGFGGMRRLDLEAGTNSEGKVKFAGLPVRVQRPPLEFQASKDELTGVAAFDPATECQAKREIALEKAKAQDAH